MSLVVDSSVAISWLMPDEVSRLADRAIAEAFLNGADAPTLFHSEVANGVLMGVRRRRVAFTEIAPGLADLRRMPIRHDSQGYGAALDAVLDLAMRHGLSVYDATYLELARRLRRPLATLDQELRDAAIAEGAELFTA